MEMNAFEKESKALDNQSEKKQYLTNNAKRLMKLFDNRENDNYYYWKFCYIICVVLQETWYCNLYSDKRERGYNSAWNHLGFAPIRKSVTNAVKICTDLQKLKSAASYDKDLYHMGEVVYTENKHIEIYDDRPIMAIVERYSERHRAKGENYYQIFTLYCRKLLGLKIKMDDEVRKALEDVSAHKSGSTWSLIYRQSTHGGATKKDITPENVKKLYSGEERKKIEDMCKKYGGKNARCNRMEDQKKWDKEDKEKREKRRKKLRVIRKKLLPVLPKKLKF